MNFRSLFNKVAGERQREEVAATPVAKTEVKPATTAPAVVQGRPEPRREPSPAVPETDPMKLAQVRLATKRRTRIAVRGITRYGRSGYSGIFSPGETVSLERDPSNPYDANAVKVLLADGSMLGYVAREMAASISRELAEGWTFKVRISEGPFVEDKWGQCELELMDKCPSERGVQHGVS